MRSLNKQTTLRVERMVDDKEHPKDFNARRPLTEYVLFFDKSTDCFVFGEKKRPDKK